MSQIKREESKKSTSLLQRTYMMPKRPMTSRHQQIFLGNCYTCNNFGHMARNCKLMVPIEKGITPQNYFYKKNGIRATGQGFETHPARVGGEIVGNWVQHSHEFHDMD